MSTADAHPDDLCACHVGSPAWITREAEIAERVDRYAGAFREENRKLLAIIHSLRARQGNEAEQFDTGSYNPELRCGSCSQHVAIASLMGTVQKQEAEIHRFRSAVAKVEADVRRHGRVSSVTVSELLTALNGSDVVRGGSA